MSNIHPTAIIDEGARIHGEACIGPYCVIGPKVVIGAGSRLISHINVMGRTTIGENNTIFPQATLGAAPQDLKYYGEDSELIIGDHNQVRESVTCHVGTENGGGKTTVGNHNLLMGSSHVAHDCYVGDHCVFANNVMLAGHITIEDHAVISGGAAITHYVTVGRHAFIGGLAGVVHDCPPFMVSDGHPSRVRSINAVGLKRHNFANQTVDRLKAAYRALFRSSNGEAGSRPATTMAENLDRLENEFPDDECIGILTRFVRNAATGVHGRHRESERRDDKWITPTR